MSGEQQNNEASSGGEAQAVAAQNLFDAPGPDRIDPAADAVNGDAFVVDLEGFEGPVDLLLALARQQKVDLMNISILALAEQYLGYIEAARRIRLEIAADYLVMAAWLAFLKSRLLLRPFQLPTQPRGQAAVQALRRLIPEYHQSG